MNVLPLGPNNISVVVTPFKKEHVEIMMLILAWNGVLGVMWKTAIVKMAGTIQEIQDGSLQPPAPRKSKKNNDTETILALVVLALTQLAQLNGSTQVIQGIKPIIQTAEFVWYVYLEAVQERLLMIQTVEL